MDSTEEPQKKVFKARKTMRVSDRQQLEAVYKVKEELLKTTEVKLLNGKHENGDSDINSLLSNTDCTEVKKEINGMVDLCVNSEEGKTACDEISKTKSPESRAGNMAGDIESKPLMLSSENFTPEQAKDADIAVKCEAENGVGSSKDNFHEENNKKDHLDQRKNDIPLEGESKPVCLAPDISDSSEEKEETNYLPVNSSSSGGEKRTEEVTAKEVVGEAAISSSMEADQEKQEGSAGPAETTVSKTIDEPSESILDNTDSMETDDIIPILEKLAPAEDDLSCFSKSSLLPVDDTVPDLEEKIDSCLGSPSKQESNESLPKEAFLVLSDEDDPCDEKEELVEGILPNKSSLPEEVEGERKKECEDKEGEEAHKEEEIQIEKNEASKRKRSKSEDMDNVHSKHRRYMGEDYEAELQVKITARKDVDLKLQKIIQRLLEEKLTALQCAVFDKTLADLKTRMEKVECNKRHKTVLTEMQAKIARLTKRVGAAKEDLKKRQENVANAPVSPGKAAPDPANVNNATYRNAGTVRQMLESKRNVGESTPATFQAPANPVPASSLAASPAVVSGHPKLQTPVSSSSSLTTAVLPTANTATVVGTNAVPTGSTQSVSVSLQSLPVILHVPVAVSSQTQLLQGHTGTLVSNQPSGNVEFISVQNSSTVGSLTKTTVSLASTNTTKPNNIPLVPSPGILRTSTASAGSIGTTLAVQAVPTSHPVAQTTRTSLPAVGTPGLYNATASRAPLQMKLPLPAFNSTAPTEPPTIAAPKIENQTSRPPTDTSANKRPAEGTTQSGKFTGSESGGVIDLTLDEEDDSCSQADGKKQKQNQNQAPVPGLSIPTQPLTRPLQPLPPLQPSPVQQPGVPTSGPSQTTIHVLPTASTAVNVTHRPVAPANPKLPIPRTPANHQVVYTTIPAPPAQNPVRGAVMTSPGLRPVTPQTGGVTVRMPQTTYVVNNGLALGSGAPQLTVHHRPPPQAHTEPPRPIHPAPLPEAPQPPRLPPEAANTSPPQKPQLKLARVQSQNGIVLSWSVMEVDRSCATVDSYHLYAYHEDPSATMASQWKKIGEVKALPLPMACTLTQFVSGSKYYFAVRAKDVYGRFGPFCDPQSTDVISSQSS
ncbi:activating transcription factor 7-interacting protein 1 isoform X1 [Camarhynchus parvulus]|uniref:Activating transcription factor 7 interacting protein n=1 Tax=Geospiza parvula TaxID=87175 RepID=A0A8C3QA75_GEOPR|nr:activating transcription factor 7-interacting protein 1 isoform X1 [Camarhynchus parvulus]XP_030816581.1 activating transcription factor 7-interacting protein 1 isoform X1 [Camarhynchus parvulus]XP_030816582.1 activating transcription factor 7-interacting protein 1 isoform X1 [Camarhynchus parvulus]XP_030816583.1 activating transcription factor 7-interacting protein 1 isoform X1 [Camarhynchus parvulus]XP_030816584.1 activating transcription factor 7-interacting protein 1 isoform X1 [Camarhyn